MESSPLPRKAPRFRFVVWNDLHVRDPRRIAHWPPYSYANEKAAWLVECSLGRHGCAVPDFILSAGDIIEGEKGNCARDLPIMKALLLDRINVPFLPCLGNHENEGGEGSSESNRAYDQFFGPLWHNYVFVVGGMGFVVLDSSSSERVPDAVTAAREAFLARALDRLGDRPVIVVSHAPLIPMRQPAVLEKSFGFPSWKVQAPGLLELVERNRGRVVAVLSGHLHLTAIREQAGIYHVVAAGTNGYPSDFAIVEAFDDYLTVEMRALPREWLVREGDIHGRPRHPIDYTDSDHPDHESYLWGNPDERAVRIPLAGAKQPAAGSQNEKLTVLLETAPGQWTSPG